MQNDDFEEEQQSQPKSSNLSRTRQKQIQRELVKRYGARTLKLAWFLIPLVILAAAYLKSEPAQTVADKPRSASAVTTEAPVKKVAITTTTTLAAITSTTIGQTVVEKEATETIFFLGLGNTSFGGQVAEMIEDKGIEEPFSDISTVLKNGDVVLGNLESALAPGTSPSEDKSYYMRGTPEAAKGMKAAGINLVSLANDRIMYFGDNGLRSTVNALNQAGIASAGAGNNSQEAYTSKIINVKGKKVALLAFSDVTADGELATSDQAGTACFPERNEISAIIREAAKESDYLIISCHWGEEFGDAIGEHQRRFARRAIDAGADIVMGHHPHAMHGIELYNGKLIAYSMGDFIFAPGTIDYNETFILKLSLAKGMIVGAEVVPVVIDYNGKPSIAAGCAATSILKKLRDMSEPYGTVVNILGDTAQVH
ncbi:MAG: CapA family protein [Actinomycetota bacterium]|nr:CapA family protein [Actinomycetota bacterium]